MPINIDPKVIPEGFYWHWQEAIKNNITYTDRRKIRKVKSIDDVHAIIMKWQVLAFRETCEYFDKDWEPEIAQEIFIALLAEEMRKEEGLSETEILVDLTERNIHLREANDPNEIVRMRDVDLPYEDKPIN